MELLFDILKNIMGTGLILGINYLAFTGWNYLWITAYLLIKGDAKTITMLKDEPKGFSFFDALYMLFLLYFFMVILFTFIKALSVMQTPFIFSFVAYVVDFYAMDLYYHSSLSPFAFATYLILIMMNFMFVLNKGYQKSIRSFYAKMLCKFIQKDMSC